MAGIERGTTHIPPSLSSTAATSTLSASTSTAAGASSSASASGQEGEAGKGKRPKLPSFWIPSLTPKAKPTEIKKPVRLCYHSLRKETYLIMNSVLCYMFI